MMRWILNVIRALLGKDLEVIKDIQLEVEFMATQIEQLQADFDALKGAVTDYMANVTKLVADAVAAAQAGNTAALDSLDAAIKAETDVVKGVVTPVVAPVVEPVVTPPAA